MVVGSFLNPRELDFTRVSSRESLYDLDRGSLQSILSSEAEIHIKGPVKTTVFVERARRRVYGFPFPPT